MLALSAVLACACGPIPGLIPDTRTPRDFARELEPRCAAYPESDFASLLSRDTLDGVEPSVAHVRAGSLDPEARLQGVRIHLRPLPGFTPELLTRRVECHQARVVLGQVTPVPDDPYVLPGRWLDLNASAERDGFVVRAEVQPIALARQVLERAQRFVAPRAL